MNKNNNFLCIPEIGLVVNMDNVVWITKSDYGIDYMISNGSKYQIHLSCDEDDMVKRKIEEWCMFGSR